MQVVYDPSHVLGDGWRRVLRAGLGRWLCYALAARQAVGERYALPGPACAGHRLGG
jgi:hypothetical protein